MALSEFSLIERYFSNAVSQRGDVALGVGDDAAIVIPPADQTIVMSMDTMVSEVHFSLEASAQNIGYKSLAVNLSDMAAMGAEPAWILLALTLPQVEESWLKEFSVGLAGLAEQYGVALVGGDTTKGPLAMTIQISGFVPTGQALTRQGAKVGDLIFVTGQLGDAGLGLQLLRNNLSTVSPARRGYFIQRLERPTPRVDVGMALRGLASAAIDVSDGLAADLGHILEASHVGATIIIDDLPVSDELKQMNERERLQLALSVGDDYELCFTVSSEDEPAMREALTILDCPATCIGIIDAEEGLRLSRKNGTTASFEQQGYDHFG
jgi:thiamine-monophosphate kinase